MKSFFLHSAFTSAFSLLISIISVGQYAPPPGSDGSTAIHADSSVIIGWANNAVIQRGYINASDSSLGKVTYGEPDNATGEADNQVVSLGDGGVAVYEMDPPLADGQGPDFAVFENSFSDDFLELAFVEVSTGGENFLRVPSGSLTQTNTQVSSFGTIQAVEIYNLAGKYRAFFGTPFDLAELSDSTGADLTNITHVRIVDVIGSLDEALATYDSQGNAINDPWPTEFASGGFDLDALAVMHTQNTINGMEEIFSEIKTYPNPVENELIISNTRGVSEIRILSSTGQLVELIKKPGKRTLVNMGPSGEGLYLVQLIKNGISHTKRIIKR